MEREKEAIAQLKDIVKRLRHSGLSSQQIIDTVARSLPDEGFILPLSIFIKELGALESIVVYLHENCGLRYSKIGELLGRNAIVVGNSYRAARRKYIGCLTVMPGTSVPVSLFKDRKFSVQRTLVRYLHDDCHLNFSEIGRRIARNPRTVWTAYHAGGSR